MVFLGANITETYRLLSGRGKDFVVLNATRLPFSTRIYDLEEVCLFTREDNAIFHRQRGNGAPC